MRPGTTSSSRDSSRRMFAFPPSNRSAGSDHATTIRFAASYLAGGFADAGQQSRDFSRRSSSRTPPARWRRAGLGVEFAAQQAGGFATPNLAITSLTRSAGPLGGDVTKALANQFDPTQVFKKGDGHALRRLRSGRSAAAGVRRTRTRPGCRTAATAPRSLPSSSGRRPVAPPPLPKAIVTFHEHRRHGPEGSRGVPEGARGG